MARWKAAGWLHSVHFGAYSVGHRSLTEHTRRRAAVMVAGEGAALSHVSAAVHRGLLGWRPRDVDVMVPRGGERDRPGICFHRPRIYGTEDVDVVDGIPCTTVARTLVDLAGAVRPRHLERALQRAEYLGVLDVKAIAEVLRRISRPRGVRHLRRLLGRARLEGSAMESLLERTYADALQAAGVEPPQTQVVFRVGPERIARVDFYWRRHGLVVEVDGPHHALPLFAADDERRDRELRRQGLRVHRYTDLDIEADIDGVVSDTRTLMASRDE